MDGTVDGIGEVGVGDQWDYVTHAWNADADVVEYL